MITDGGHRIPPVVDPFALLNGIKCRRRQHMGKARKVALQRHLQRTLLGHGKPQLAFLVLIILCAQYHIKQIPVRAFHRPADDPCPCPDKVLRLYFGAIAPAGALSQRKGINRALCRIIGGRYLPALGSGAHGNALLVHSGQSLIQQPHHCAGGKAAVIQRRVGIHRLAGDPDRHHTGVAHGSRQIFLAAAAACHHQQCNGQQQRQCFFHALSSL